VIIPLTIICIFSIATSLIQTCKMWKVEEELFQMHETFLILEEEFMQLKQEVKKR